MPIRDRYDRLRGMFGAFAGMSTQLVAWTL